MSPDRHVQPAAEDRAASPLIRQAAGWHGRLRHEPQATALQPCRRCHRTAPHLNSPPTRYRELITEEGEVFGVLCPDCRGLREQRAIQAEKARVIRRLKRGLPL